MITSILVTEAVAILLLGVLVVGLLRSHAELIRTLHTAGLTDDHHGDNEGPSRPRPRLNDSPPADISGQSLTGSALHIGVAGSSGHTLLAFLSSGCSACMGLWEELRSEDSAKAVPDARLVVVTKGPEAESQSKLVDLAPNGVTLLQSTAAWEDYGVPVSPYFVLIDGPTGSIVGEGSTTSWANVRSLLGQAANDAGHEANTPDDEMRADAELRRAGIGPGHPSLRPDRPPMGDD